MLDLVQLWLARYAVEWHDFEARPPFRFVLYGHQIVTYSQRPGRYAFILIKLPSWQWGRHDYGRRWGWQQLHVGWQSAQGWLFDYL